MSWLYTNQVIEISYIPSSTSFCETFAEYLGRWGSLIWADFVLFWKFLTLLVLILLNFQLKNCSIFNNSCNIGLNIMKLHWFTLLDWGLFNNAKEHNKRHLGLKILMWQESKTNKQPSLINRLVWLVLLSQVWNHYPTNFSFHNQNLFFSWICNEKNIQNSISHTT